MPLQGKGCAKETSLIYQWLARNANPDCAMLVQMSAPITGNGSMQPLGIIAAHFAADVGTQAATGACQALHLSDSPGSCAGVVVPVGLPVDELDFDLSIANLIGLHTGIATEISISAHRRLP